MDKDTIVKVTLVQRPLPEITTPTDSGLSWKQVHEQQGRMNPLVWLRLLWRPWLTVCAPKGTECCMTNMYGDPLYIYKMLGERTYLLRMYPSPGFPGS